VRSPRLVVTTILAVGLLAGSGLGAAAQDEPDATYYELVGSGAYEGLSAVIFELHLGVQRGLADELLLRTGLRSEPLTQTRRLR
jgi:hypothetical protein